MIGQSVQEAISYLRRGELVAIPTETVYGLAGNALDPSVVLKIFEVKNRPAFDPLIVHTSSVDRIFDYAAPFPEPLQLLARKFMPGPLTLLLDRLPVIPDLVTSGLPRVAIRIPFHSLAQKLLEQLDFPLAAPSANPFGYISPTTAHHVAQQLGDRIPYILDGGACTVGVESTIIGMEEHRIVVYRQGGLPLEDIEQLVGPVTVQPHSSSNPSAPGMLKSHYAPRTPVSQNTPEQLIQSFPPHRVGLLRFREKHPLVPALQQMVLSEKGDLAEAARRLFAALRHLDGLELDIIGVEAAPDHGLGRAINDRLQRAAVTPNH